MNYYLYLWLGVFIVCLVIEIPTMGLTSIWFSVGALVSMLLAALDVPLWAQITAFVAVSLILMIAVRPMASRFINNKRTKTNLDEVPGKVGMVVEDINNIEGTGRVIVEGVDWMARCKNNEDSPILKDTMVEVVSVEGVKLMVIKK